MNVLIITLAISLGGVPQAAARAKSAGAGMPSGELREQVRTFLSTIDTPVTAQQWRALGPDAAAVLMEVAGGESELPTRRARAVEALGMRQDAAAAKLVNDLAARASNKVIRLAAVRAMPQVSKSAAAQAALAPILEDADVHVRAAAASALSSLGTGGCQLAQKRLKRESGEERAVMERSTAACNKP
jgi:hypothetical protein